MLDRRGRRAKVRPIEAERKERRETWGVGYGE